MASALPSRPDGTADPAQRSRALHDIAGIIRVNRDRLARAVARETGKPVGHATREVSGSADYFDYYADARLPRRSFAATSRCACRGGSGPSAWSAP